VPGTREPGPCSAGLRWVMTPAGWFASN
jgi:hypothetical protein